MKYTFVLIFSLIMLMQSCKSTQSLHLTSDSNVRIVDEKVKKTTLDTSNIEILHQFANDSFEEDLPKTNKSPVNWKYCGDDKEINIDIHQNDNNLFNVSQTTNFGNRYIGLRTSYNDTWGIISQRLDHNLLQGNSYLFYLSACRSAAYFNQERKGGENLNEAPVRIRIWAGVDYCDKKEMLADTPLIEHEDWRTYMFELKPKSTHSFFTIEVYFKKKAFYPYNGNVLIDNLSPVYRIE